MVAIRIRMETAGCLVIVAFLAGSNFGSIKRLGVQRAETTARSAFTRQVSGPVTGTSTSRIGILQLQTPEVAPRYSLAVSQVGCWAARNGYMHYVESYVPPDHASVTRVRDAKIAFTRKYLPFVDWLLLLDADANVVDMNCRIETHIPVTGGNYSSTSPLPWNGEFDLVLSVREHTGEPMSGAVLLRNSDWGWTFLKLWSRLSDAAPGRDNDSMILAMLEVLNGTLPGRPTLPCKQTPRHRCLYDAAEGRVGRLPHILLAPAFHGIMRSLWREWTGIFPNYCLVHGHANVGTDDDHLRPQDALCPPDSDKRSNGPSWTRPELVIGEEEARDQIQNFVQRFGIGPDLNTGQVKFNLLAKCYPNCLLDSRVSWI